MKPPSGGGRRAGWSSRWWPCSRSAAASSWPSRYSARDRGRPSSAAAPAPETSYSWARGKRGARVVRRLGRPDRARDVVEGLMLDRGLYRSYPRAASAEAQAALDEPYAADARVDLRELPTFTIDPDDAKDFDDAISARREDGRVRLWVHIADVTAYLRPGGRLEREAFRRGTSVYVPRAVEPMLPEVLSNQACSLRPGEDRLAVTVEMEMDGADVTSVAFHRSLVRSDRRLTYGEVDELFAGGPARRRHGASRSRSRATWHARCASGATRSSSGPGSRPSTSTPRATRPGCATRSRPSRTA